MLEGEKPKAELSLLLFPLLLGMLTITQLVNITHLEGMKDDFSNLLMQVTTANSTYAASYTIVDEDDGNWALLNVTVPEENYTLAAGMSVDASSSENPDNQPTENVTPSEANAVESDNATAPPNIGQGGGNASAPVENVSNPTSGNGSTGSDTTIGNVSNSSTDNNSIGMYADIGTYINMTNQTGATDNQSNGSTPGIVDIDAYLNMTNQTGNLSLSNGSIANPVGLPAGVNLSIISENNGVVTLSLGKGMKPIKVQRKVYDGLKGNATLRIIVRYKNRLNSSDFNLTDIPAGKMAAMFANLSTLAKLAGSDVDEILPDTQMAASLVDSVPIIEADRVQNELNMTGMGVSVCLLDTGVDPSKVQNVLPGYDFINNDNDSMDDNGHGTFMASVIHAIAPDATIIPVKVLDSNGTGYSSTIIQGIEYCQQAHPDAKIISMSFGGGLFTGYCDDDPVAQMADQASAAGFFISSSAGNDGSDHVTSPACAMNATAVSSSTKDDSVSSFSNMNGMVDLLAPGDSITAQGLSGDETRSGTSISAADVSGAAALLLQSEPALAPADVENRFKTTGIMIDFNQANYSRVDVYNALTDNVTGEPTNQSVNSTNATWGFAYSAEYTSDYNAIIAYRSNTGASLLLSPKIRFWNSSGAGAWGAEIELPSAGSAVQWAKVRWSPISSKIVVVSLSADGNLDGYVCMANCTNVSKWNYTSNIGFVGAAPAQRKFDMDFESSTGNLVLVYGISDVATTHDLGYKVLPSATTNFTGLTEQYLDDSGHATDLTYTWVRTARKPGASREIGLIGFDSTDNDINAWIWNGTAWGNQVSISDTATSTGGRETLAIRYAADGSKALVMGDDAVATRNIAYGNWNGTAWSAMTIFRFALGSGNVQWLNIKADPLTDDMQAVIITSTPSLYTGYWNGSAMAFSASLDAGLDTVAARCADFDWNGTTSTGVLVWDTDGVGTTLSQLACTPQCAGAGTTISTYAGTGAWVTLYRNVLTGANTNSILGARLNNAFDIGSFRYTGAAYTNYGDNAITADTTVTTYEAYDLDYNEIDTVPPNVNFTSPTPVNNTFQKLNWLYANVTASDNIALSNVILEFNNSNHSMIQGTGTNWYLNWTGISDGTYPYKVWAVDVAGNTNVTEIRYITVDTVAPGITFVSPTPGNNTARSLDWAYINITANETLNASLLEWNGANVSMTNNSGTNWYYNKTGLASGVYTYRVFGNDSAGNSGVSATYTLTIDTAGPQWSNPAINTTPVYWNQTVSFNTSWTNVGLAGYIFSTNQSGAWANSSYVAFSGSTNTSLNVSTITASSGSSVGWFFWANDSVGNSNQTAIQTFTVQSRPAALNLSLNQTTYQQGDSPGEGNDQNISFQARYLDNLTGQAIPGAACYVTNNETSDNITLAFNSTTGNYTGILDDYLLFDSVGFNATCSAGNFTSQNSSASANVWYYSYLWNWTNLSYSTSSYTQYWIRTKNTTGPAANLTKAESLGTGSTFIVQFPVLGTGINRSIVTDYLILGLHYLRLNVSMTSALAASCKAYICANQTDFNLNPLYVDCIPQQSMSADTPTLLSNSSNNNISIMQNDYLFVDLYLNCTSPSSGDVSVYYNYSGEAPVLEAVHAQPTLLNSYVAAFTQADNAYPLAPNQSLNASRKFWITFNNTQSHPFFTQYVFTAQIKPGYFNSNNPNHIYVYNSTGGLWASDNSSAGAPGVATSLPDNRVSWVTESFPGNTASNETMQRGILNAIRDNESSIQDTASGKLWNITVFSIFNPTITLYNVSVWTNYSSYGALDNFSFMANLTNSSGTYDISGLIVKDTSNKTLAFPALDFSDSVYYTVFAINTTPPVITFVNMTPQNASSRNLNWAYINVTADKDLGAALLEWNGANVSMSNISATNWHYNETGLGDGTYAYRVFGNDTFGNIGVSETRTITIDTLAPIITFVNQTPANGTVRNLDWAYINITSSEPLNASLLEWNGTNQSMSGSGTNWFLNKTGLAFGNYTYRVFGNDSAGNQGVSGTRAYIYDAPPSIIVIEPLGGNYPNIKPVPIVINATDPDGISSVIASVFHPVSNVTQNITLYIPPKQDNFDSNSVGRAWFVENSSIGPSQTCVANINGTVPGKAFTSLSGDGSPLSDTLCSLVTIYPMYGDFDLNVSFDVLSQGPDSAINLEVMDVNTSADASSLAFISLSNWTGLGKNYEVFVDDGNTSGYISRNPTNDTSGGFRIKRAGSNFSFYVWNSTGSSWALQNSSTLNYGNDLFIAIESESAFDGWGAMDASWDNLSYSGLPYYMNIFYDPGHISVMHTITFYVNDSYGAVNNSETTNFTLIHVNSRPSKPFILAPAPASAVFGMYNITWSSITDLDNDTLRFNITLLNADGSVNATIAAAYGNASSSNYPWNTSVYPDGTYSLRVTVYENQTAEGLSSSFTLPGTFYINNHPPSVIILSPLGEAHYQTAQVSLSVNATNPFGIGTGIAQVTYPNGTKANFTLHNAQQSDNFSNNTIGADWFRENTSIGPSQACIADINTTYPGKAYISLSGFGGPMVDTYCSLISGKPLDGDFDINISFNITGKAGSDNALFFSAIERNSSATASEYISMDLSNYTGLGRNYDIYMAGENFSDYVYMQPTNDTYGKFRMVRTGDLFTFYIWNNTNNSWYLANSTSMAICRPLYVSLDSESALPGWGSMNVTWDDFGASGDGALFYDFGDTMQLGLYNVTFFVNNTLGVMNGSEKTNFTIFAEDQPPSKPFLFYPTVGSLLNGTINISISQVHDYENDSVRFNVTLLNPDGSDNLTVATDYGNISFTGAPWDTTVYPDGEYSVRITVYENETPEHLSNSYTLPGTFFIDNNAPSIIIIYPHGETLPQSRPVSISINATDSNGISSAIAQVTLPNSTKENITLGKGQQDDSFDWDTMGVNWVREDALVGPMQTCFTDINTSILGKAYTSLNGNGTPVSLSLCSLISKKAIDGDFDIQIDFNIESETGPDNALDFQIMRLPTSAFAARAMFIGLSNFSGEGKTYKVFADDGNASGYILQRPTNDTSGKMRIKRVGDYFTFYTWNSTSSGWTVENVSQNIFNFSRAVYASFESVSKFPQYGGIDVSWDNFSVISGGNDSYFGMFNDTALLGLYNVSIFVNDTLGFPNETERTNFTIQHLDTPPSVPYLLAPAPGEFVEGMYTITWANVYDFDNDKLRFNITLFNPDLSINSSIIANYGDMSSTDFLWNTTAYPDGNYSMEITVYENETPEGLSNGNALIGNFTIDNSLPLVQFVPPTEISGSVKYGNDINVNVTAYHPKLNVIHIRLFNSSGALINESFSGISPLFTDFTNLSSGLYYFNASALDDYGHENVTETRNVTLTTINISNVSATPSPDGFGFNVTIRANATGASSVLVGVTPPGANQTNHTMASLGNGTFSYNYSAWTNGTYSYVIYASLGYGDWVNSSANIFTLFQNISIQARTLKDYYMQNETINITDPEFVNLDAPKLTETSFGNGWMPPQTEDIQQLKAATKAFASKNSKGLPISARVQDQYGVRRVDAIIPTLIGEERVPLSLVKGTANDGVWQAAWVPHDLTGKHFIIMIEAENAKRINDTSYVSVGDPPGLWVIPTADSDPTGLWSNRFNARDGDTHTYAEDNSNPGAGYGSFIYFNITQITSDRVRVWSDYDIQVSAADIDVYDGTKWINSYEGPIPNLAWFEANFSTTNITAARFRYLYNTGGWIYWLYEFQFYNVSTHVNIPVVATRAATSVEETTAILHSTILSDGGDTSQVRFLYGNASGAHTNSTPWVSDLFTSSSLGEMLHGLSDNQRYYFIAQVNNSAGQSNGSEDFFTTGTPLSGWLTPTGYEDPAGRWNNEPKAFDDELSSEAGSFHAVNDVNGVWSSYLYLNRTPSIESKRVRFNAKATDVDMAEISVFANGSWVTVYNASFTDSAWTQTAYNLSNVSQARIRFRAVANNRGFEFRLAEFDFFKSPITEIANQSRLDNWGPTNASCYLLMKTQFWNGSAWLNDDVVVNETAQRILEVTDVLKLDTIWNPKNYSSNNLSFGTGVYRVYSACLDNQSNVLMDINGSFVNHTYNFTFDTTNPIVNITSPQNGTNYTLTSTIPIKVNVTEDFVVDTVLANVSSSIGYEMVTLVFNSTSGLWEYNYLNTNYLGVYTIRAIANDTAGNVNDSEYVQVNVIDITPPVVLLDVPPDNAIYSPTTTTNITFRCNVSDNYDVHNISLYITNPSNVSFSRNSTMPVSGVFSFAEFSMNITSGNYTWNCLAFDSSGNSAWGAANRTLIIRFVKPTMALNKTAPAQLNSTDVLTFSMNFSTTFNGTGTGAPQLWSGLTFFHNSTTWETAPQPSFSPDPELWVAFQHWTNETTPPNDTYGGNYWEIYAMHSSDNMQTWSLITAITNNSVADLEPNLLYDNTNSTIVVYQEDVGGQFELSLANSTDGLTWTKRLITNTAYDELDPSIEQDTSGMYFVAFTATIAPDTDSEIYIMNSSNLYNWSAPYAITNNTYPDGDPDLLEYNGTVYLAWSPVVTPGTKEVFFSKATDPFNISEWTANTVQATNSTIDSFEPSLFIDRYQQIFISYNSWNSTNNTNKSTMEIMLANSSLANESAWSLVQITHNSVRDEYPGIAQDTNGLFYIFFAEDNGSGPRLVHMDRALEDADARNVTIWDKIPANTTLVNGSITGGGVETNGTIKWTLGTMHAGRDAIVSFKVTVNPSIMDGSLINNTVFMNYSDSNGTLVETLNSTSSTIILSVCPVISAGGIYNQTSDFFGAPNNATPLGGYACVKINASDVVFDCKGYNITGDSNATATYGILVNGPLTNVTLRNCPGVSNYTDGIYVLNSSIAITNSSSGNNTYGIQLINSSGVNLSGSNFTDNTNGGITIDAGSSGANLSSSSFCGNGMDVQNLGTSNIGRLDRCDSFLNWSENNHYGCEYSCSDLWHRFFGNANGTIVLGNGTTYVYHWNATAFNIYFIDSDSVMDWNALQAIGRNTTNGTSSNDFTELDTAFNTTGFPDNINKTFSSDGTSPLDTRNYTIYTRDINFIPVANSTHYSTLFRTGILWDTSDGGAEYSNAFNQSTAWMVRINASTADTYGTYDFLSQIPYTLATREGAGNTIAIYLELK